MHWVPPSQSHPWASLKQPRSYHLRAPPVEPLPGQTHCIHAPTCSQHTHTTYVHPDWIEPPMTWASHMYIHAQLEEPGHIACLYGIV